MKLSLINITTAAIVQRLLLCSQCAFAMDGGLKGTRRNTNSDSNIQKQKINRKLEGEGGPLVALVKDIDGPDNAGMYDVFGTVSLRFNKKEGTPNLFTLKITAGGLTDFDGGAFISTLTSCPNSLDINDINNIVLPEGETGWSDKSWSLIGDNNGGISQSTFPFDFGLTSEDSVGKAVFLTNGSTVTNDSTVIACGVLEEQTKSARLSTQLSKYPGYVGDLNVEGRVRANFRSDGTITMRYKMKGLENQCVGCGIHIHAGVSCADKEGPNSPYGHGWNSRVTQDLWKPVGGAVYNSNGKGKSKGEFPMYTGFGKYETMNHAVVVHAQNGTRIGCGTLGFI